ncbi:hypothetical protein GcC1_175031 [Golovinomyces cichoracearum]|uniref:Uncharacterized protein n=1 Tax=Golovinomyces cichoracearum TaxID=62708 RepID=A0A420HPN8_9PEZI|nr:hypothetical protein GcC1_175031 [Golovinomyces cichoracearum]
MKFKEKDPVRQFTPHPKLDHDSTLCPANKFENVMTVKDSDIYQRIVPNQKLVTITINISSISVMKFLMRIIRLKIKNTK